MYAILKDAKADLEEAARRVDEGQFTVFYFQCYIIKQCYFWCLVNRLVKICKARYNDNVCLLSMYVSVTN